MDLYLLHTERGYRLHTPTVGAKSLEERLNGNSYSTLTKELLQYVPKGELNISYSHHLDEADASVIYKKILSGGKIKQVAYTALSAIGFVISLPILLPTGASIFFGGLTVHHLLKLRKLDTFQSAALNPCEDATLLEEQLNCPYKLGDEPANLATGEDRDYA